MKQIGVMFKIDEDIHMKLKLLLTIRGEKLNSIMRKAIDAYIEEHKEESEKLMQKMAVK